MTEIIPFNNDPTEEKPERRVTEVLIVASQELIRDVLRSTLASTDSIRVIGESRQGSEAMRAVEELKPDVVLVESQIGPEAEGVRSGYRFKAARPSLGIVVLAEGLSSDVMQYLTSKTKTGWSFISRSAALDSSRLVQAIEKSAGGTGIIDTGSERSANNSSVPVLERLTGIQTQVLELVAAGMSDDGIATALSLMLEEAETLIESLYVDMHIEDGPRIDRRVIATLVYLRETVKLRS